MTASVHVKQAVMITPCEPTPNHILQLSALDSQLFVRFTFEYLLVYKPRHGINRAAVTDIVKSALGQALVPYYPLAGRVRSRADGLGLEVVCRAQGAAFIDAVSSYTVSEFEGVGPWRKFLSLNVDDVLKGAPPVVVQLTWLSDGGAALAVGFNHCLCDGTGSGEFLNLFAELAIGKHGLSELKPKPVWSRHLLDPKSFGPTHKSPLSQLEFERVPDLCGFNRRYVSEKLTPTCVTFDRKKIDELKKLAENTFTSFEVLSAHVWRSWAKGMNLPSDQIVKLIFSVNFRKRVNPSFPTGYYGNAFVLGCAQTSMRDLTGGKGLSHAAELVKGAKEKVGDDYVREVVEFVSRTHANVDSVGVLIMTQWSRLGLNNVDFGIGRPVQVGPIFSDKYCFILPVCDVADALKVSLAVPHSAIDQYLCSLKNNCA